MVLRYSVENKHLYSYLSILRWQFNEKYFQWNLNYIFLYFRHHTLSHKFFPWQVNALSSCYLNHFADHRNAWLRMKYDDLSFWKGKKCKNFSVWHSFKKSGICTLAEKKWIFIKNWLVLWVGASLLDFCIDQFSHFQTGKLVN